MRPPAGKAKAKEKLAVGNARPTMTQEQKVGIYRYFAEKEIKDCYFPEDCPWPPGVMSAKEMNQELRSMFKEFKEHAVASLKQLDAKGGHLSDGEPPADGDGGRLTNTTNSRL
ncbi:hypothetical protein ACP70R_005405 [Stipagrostis hirtigluma subsp. patula]